MTTLNRLVITLALFAVLLDGSSLPCLAYNDCMFPPQPAAAAAIDFDQKGFIIQGKRTFLVSAGIEYARVPRALWYDRLLRLKRAGFNCIETYTFWNFHEPVEGRFDFNGDHDLDAFLKLVHQMGMYAIVRVGPYSCAEWDSGGYPIWLRFKPGLSVREDNALFEHYVDRWFDKLIPIVAANQINRGGSVILVQLENEYPLGWTHKPSEGYGTDICNGYFQNLHDKAVALGIQVPYFFSGMHHSSDPADYNGGNPLDDPQRPNPWITTEYWSVWFSNYGVPVSDNSEYGSTAALYGRRTWKILANGGNGYNVYMGHGGTNFGYNNSDNCAASYDYGAPVGQTGDLRPTYYAFKRVGLFARSFEDILENSVNGPGEESATVANPVLKVRSRVSPYGTISFLDNSTSSVANTTIVPPSSRSYSRSDTVSLAPGEIMPVVGNFKLNANLTLAWAPTRILGIVQQGKTTTLITYGAAGSTDELHFIGNSSIYFSSAEAGLKAEGKNGVVFKTLFADGPPTESWIGCGASTVRIISETPTSADRTWLVDSNGEPYVICGPEYVGDTSIKNGLFSIVSERPWSSTSSASEVSNGRVYGPGSSCTLQAVSEVPQVHQTDLPLGAWHERSGNVAAGEGNDRAWKFTSDPMPMGADGDLTADAWYQTTLDIHSNGTYILDFASAADRVKVYLDGTEVPQDRAPRNSIIFTTEVGKHQLTIFTAHDGRQDFFPWIGPIDTKYAKGLLGPAGLSLLEGEPQPVNGWRIFVLAGDPGPNAAPPPADGAGWKDYKAGDSDFNNHPGFGWVEATVTVNGQPGQQTSLHCDSVDFSGEVYLNGALIPGKHGVNEPFEVPLPDGTSSVAILVQNNYGRGGISPVVTVTRSTPSTVISGWKMSGGPGDPAAKGIWMAVPSSGQDPGPTFYESEFSGLEASAIGAHPIWRVTTDGLGHGSIWVNGHNLGRYPEKIGIDGLYIPECWMNSGANKIVIYDEDGRRPYQVMIASETAASRDVIRLSGLLRKERLVSSN